MRRTFSISLVILSLLLSAAPSGTQTRRTVTLLLANGKVFTADARGTIAQAIAVDGERIVAVGSDAELRARYTAARTIDLKGKLVTPGFNDAHIHFLGGGLSLLRVDLIGAKTLEEAKERIAAKARELPPGSWILGRGWDHTLWGGQWPTRADLDALTATSPGPILRRSKKPG
jgi:predicted amidohydrolase YtcJ